jgi:SAM-dependent methyltransferase
MIAMTTSSSIKVNAPSEKKRPFRSLDCGAFPTAVAFLESFATDFALAAYSQNLATCQEMRKILKRLFYMIYYPASFVWRKLDRIGSWGEQKWWIDHIPDAMFTPATYASYAGWVQNQGMFSILFSIYLEKEKPNILDFGCGMGSIAPIAYHFVRDGGKFLGIDTDARSIAACHKTYKDLKNCEFYLTRDPNAWYPQEGIQPSKPGEIDWPVQNNSQDFVIAMSVFTHLQEKDATAYLTKIHDVMAPGGRAILSFHVVRNYVNPYNDIYNFTTPLTPGWSTSMPTCPEASIGVTQDAVLKFLGNKFKVLRQIEGRVTGGKHPCHQDLFVLQKL